MPDRAALGVDSRQDLEEGKTVVSQSLSQSGRQSARLRLVRLAGLGAVGFVSWLVGCTAVSYVSRCAD